MNAFQQFLTATQGRHEFAGSILSRWGSQYWLKVGGSRSSARHGPRPGPDSTPAEIPLPSARCGTCQHFRSDPAWVAGVFSGFPGLGSGYASACAADGVCRLNHRARSAAFSCPEFGR